MTITNPQMKEASEEGLSANLRRYLRFLGYADGQWLELQALHIRARGAVRGAGFAHGDSADAIIALLTEADDSLNAQGLYLIPNRIASGVHARGTPRKWNQATQGAGLSDRDITHRTSFYIDPDPVRPSGVSANVEESKAALQKSLAVYASLSELVGADALGFGFSGSGCQISVALDNLESTPELTETVKSILEALDRLHSDSAVKIDKSVKDPKRIAPAFGTVKRKGTNLPERPHRRTWFVCANEVRRLTLAELEGLRDELLARSPVPAKTRANTSAPSKPKVSNEDSLKRANEVPIREVAARLGLSTDNVTCPWCGESNGVDFLDTKNGKNLLHCFHSRCSSKPNRSPIDLVAKLHLGVDDIQGTKGIATQVLTWFGENFGIEVPKSKPKKRPNRVTLALAAPPPAVEGEQTEEPLHYTDVGNAQRLINKHGKHLRYSATSAQWLVWDGRIWARDHQDLRVRELAKDVVADLAAEANREDDPDRRAVALDHAFRSESRASINAMVDLARSMPEVRILDTDLDAKPMLFNCANGTLDLNACELRPHSPDDLLTTIAPYAYKPEAPCSKFTALMERAKPDVEERAFRQRRAGQYLCGKPDKRFVINWGPKDTAKSTVFQILSAVLGDYAGRVPRSLLEKTYKEEHPAQLMRLAGKRFAFGAEIRGRLDIDRIKELTGEAEFPARGMGKDWIDIRRLYKLEMYSNDRPQFDFDPNDGMATRVLLDPWTVTVPKEEQIENYHEIILAEEAEGVLAWMVEGWREYQRIGLNPPASLLSETKKLTDELDTFARWLDEELELTGKSDDVLDTDTLFDRRRDWCKRNRYSAEANSAWFGRRLTESGIESGKKRGTRIGIKLKAGAPLVEELDSSDIDRMVRALSTTTTKPIVKAKPVQPYLGDVREGVTLARVVEVRPTENGSQVLVVPNGHRGHFFVDVCDVDIDELHDGYGNTVATVEYHRVEAEECIHTQARVRHLAKPALVKTERKAV